MRGQLKWKCAKEDILDDVRGARIGGGCGAALLVGRRRHDSDHVRELVGGVPERLVLMKLAAQRWSRRKLSVIPLTPF